MKSRLFLLFLLFATFVSCSSNHDSDNQTMDLYGTWETQLLGRTYFVAIGENMTGYTYTITDDYNVPNMMETSCHYDKQSGKVDLMVSGIPSTISSDIIISNNDLFYLNNNGESMPFKRKNINTFSIKGKWHEGLENDIEVIYDEYKDNGIGESYCIYNGKEEYRKPISYTLDSKNMILKTTYKDGDETVVDVWHLYNYNGNSCQIQTKENNEKYIKVQ